MVERTMSVEDKIKRAEEIYNKRREGKNRTTTVNVSSKKDFKLLKKNDNSNYRVSYHI